ncbi:hypothetical protein IscW_ISCW001970 [Ixodes scapularis]|uniref:Uncharacterized protein n=1 Tax=Ixodes scapularis TaxID=6945 RepID=B7P9K5_IXOSC|nr:hypothetical protein IscW_ISCW001970 [Ixodes scapularis]|eukprot:XP_002404587.1 hypothetical protein IscW_ISCW001970 [Ixodes scapularis]
MATSSLRYAGCPRTPPPIGGVAIRRKVVLVKSGRLLGLGGTKLSRQAMPLQQTPFERESVLHSDRWKHLAAGAAVAAASLASQEVTSGVRKRMAEWQTVAKCNGR